MHKRELSGQTAFPFGVLPYFICYYMCSATYSTYYANYLVEQGIDKRSRIMSRGRVNNHSLRLINNNYIIVLKNYIKRNVFRYGFRLLALGDSDFYLVSRLYCVKNGFSTNRTLTQNTCLIVFRKSSLGQSHNSCCRSILFQTTFILTTTALCLCIFHMHVTDFTACAGST